MKDRTSRRKPLWRALVQMIEDVIQGDESAAQNFWLLLSTELEKWVQNPSNVGSRIANDQDWSHDIVTDVWMNLQRDEYALLRKFVASAVEKGMSAAQVSARAAYLENYMRKVFKHAAITYQRRLPEYIRPRGRKKSRSPRGESSSKKYWRQHQTYISRNRPVPSDAEQKVLCQELVAPLEEILQPQERLALEMRKQERSWKDIGEAIGEDDTGRVRRRVSRARNRERQPVALALSLRGYSNAEIAEMLELDGPEHADRLVRAAKAALRRRV